MKNEVLIDGAIRVKDKRSLQKFIDSHESVAKSGHWSHSSLKRNEDPLKSLKFDKGFQFWMAQKGYTKTVVRAFAEYRDGRPATENSSMFSGVLFAFVEYY